jgi:hypothetical protein
MTKKQHQGLNQAKIILSLPEDHTMQKDNQVMVVLKTYYNKNYFLEFTAER